MITITKRFLIFALTAILIISPPISYAASPAGWTATSADAAMAGAAVTIKAFKGNGAAAMKAVTSYVPTATKVAKEIVRGGGALAVAYAMAKLLDAGVDWVLDPANNRIVYTPVVPDVAPTHCYGAPASWREVGYFATMGEACSAYAAARNAKYGSKDVGVGSGVGDSAKCFVNGQEVGMSKPPIGSDSCAPVVADAATEKYIPLTTVADQIIKDAAAGAAAPAEFIKAVAVGAANAGELDAALDAAAESTSENQTADPVNPAPPAPPFDPSAIIAAIKSVYAAVVGMSESIQVKLAEMIGIQTQTNQVINDSVDRVIANDNVKTGDIVAAIEAIEGNTLDGQVINDAVDRVIANDNVKVGDIIAAIEGIEGNTLDGQVINDAIDRVIAASEADALATQDVINQSTDKAIEAAEAETLKVTDAIDAQTEAIAAQNEWLKNTDPDADPNTTVDIITPDLTPTNTNFDFGGQCPAPFVFNGSIFGNSISITLLDTAMFCNFLSTYVKYPVYAASSLYALYILGGRKDG